MRGEFVKKASKQKATALKLAKSVKVVNANSVKKAQNAKKVKKQVVLKTPAKKIKPISKAKKPRKKETSWGQTEVVKKIKKTLHLKGGKKLLSKAQEQELKKLYKSGIATLKELCEKFKVSTATLYNYLKR